MTQVYHLCSKTKKIFFCEKKNLFACFFIQESLNNFDEFKFNNLKNKLVVF